MQCLHDHDMDMRISWFVYTSYVCSVHCFGEGEGGGGGGVQGNMPHCPGKWLIVLGKLVMCLGI